MFPMLYSWDRIIAESETRQDAGAELGATAAGSRLRARRLHNGGHDPCVSMDS